MPVVCLLTLATYDEIIPFILGGDEERKKIASLYFLKIFFLKAAET